MANATLDVKGLACPMPIVKLAKTCKGLASGDLVTVLADDPGFAPDLQAWVKTVGHELKSLTEDAGVFTAVIQVK